MPRAFAWFLALRYLLSRPVTWFGVVGIGLAVWALIVVIAVFSGFIGSIRDEVRHSAPDLLITDLPLDQSYQALQPTVAKEKDVIAVAPRLRHYGTYHQLVRGALIQHSSTVEFNNRDSDFVQLLGIEPKLEAEVTPLREWLRPPDPGAAAEKGAFEVSAAAAYHGRERAGLPTAPRLADFRNRWPGVRLGKDRVKYLWLQPGDPIELLSAAVDTDKSGKVEVQPVASRVVYAGTFATGHRLFDDATAMLPIEALRQLLGHDIESDDYIDIVTDIAVKLRPGADPLAAAERLRRAVQPLLPKAAQCSVLTWEQQNKVFLDAVEIERAMMKLVLLAVMLIAGFLIYATLHMMVMQKVKDIGILGALGGSPQSLGSIFIVCGFVVGVLGCLFGTLIGSLNTIYLNPILDFLGIHLFPPEMYDLKEVPARLDPWWVLQVSSGAFLLSMLVAWLPARKAAHMNPVEALSYE